MVRFRSWTEWRLGGRARNAVAHGGVQAEVGALGGAQVGALGDGFDREGGLSAEPRRDLKFAWIALAA
jgi:hypothetical protein